MLSFSAVANTLLTKLACRGVIGGYRKGRRVNSQVRNGTWRDGPGPNPENFETAAFNHSATPPQIQNGTFFNVGRSDAAGQFARPNAVGSSHP